ncbi:hypothetical protein EDD85DRAFT_581970 [Armillaria nabsnona]|nr:hypothetical protein EDD85DRAFT_581970 [Armillaria nabsnona]
MPKYCISDELYPHNFVAIVILVTTSFGFSLVPFSAIKCLKLLSHDIHLRLYPRQSLLDVLKLPIIHRGGLNEMGACRLCGLYSSRLFDDHEETIYIYIHGVLPRTRILGRAVEPNTLGHWVHFKTATLAVARPYTYTKGSSYSSLSVIIASNAKHDGRNELYCDGGV